LVIYQESLPDARSTKCKILSVFSNSVVTYGGKIRTPR